MTMRRWALLVLAVVVSMIALTTQVASAGLSPIFDLFIGNSAIDPTYPEPYGTVQINQNGNDATITFLSNTSQPNNAYLFGDGGSVGFNFNSTSVSLVGGIPGITSENSLPNGGGFSAPIFTLGGAGNEDGFGSFNWTLNNFDGFTHAVTKIEFTVHN